MNSFYEDSKRSALDDLTNILVINEDIDLSDRKRCERFDEKHWFPVQPGATIQPNLKPRMCTRIYLAITTI